MRKCRRPRALFMASKSEIRSPVYSAIFFRCSKVFVAKQPLPLIGDFLIARPGASLSFMQVHCTRLRFRTAGISARHVTDSRTSHTSPTRLARYNIPWTSLVCFLCSCCFVFCFGRRINENQTTKSHERPRRCFLRNVSCAFVDSFRYAGNAVSVSHDAEGTSRPSCPSQMGELVPAALSHLELAQPDGLAISLPPSSCAA